MVVVGAGQAGGTAVVTLREEGFTGRVILVGREPHPPYGRPPLSKGYLSGAEEPWWVRPDEWYAENQVERLTAEAVALDPSQHRLQLADGQSLSYDRLLIATGGRNRPLELPGAGLAGVHALRTVDEADRLRQAARRGDRAIVIGMGFMGCELSAALVRAGVQVTAVFGQAQPLERVLGPEVGAAVARIHGRQGVRLSAQDSLQSIGGRGRVESVVTRALGEVACEMVVSAIGIEPDLSALTGSGIEVENGILVDARCRTSSADVFAAGDVANHLHPLFGRLRVEHFNNAEKQARCAALNMLGRDQVYDYLHTFWSDQYEHKLEYVGYAESWDRFVVRGDLEEPRFIGFYLKQGRLLAAVGLDRGGDPEMDPEEEMAVCAALVSAGATPEPEQLADQTVDLRSLLPGSSGG